MMTSVASRERREERVTFLVMAFGFPDTTQRLQRRSGTARVRCERSEGRILRCLAKPSLILNALRNLWRVGRGNAARSRLYFVGYVTVYPSVYKLPLAAP